MLAVQACPLHAPTARDEPEANRPDLLIQANATVGQTREHGRRTTQEGPDMSHVPNELPEEFPEHSALLHELKLSDAHYQRLA